MEMTSEATFHCPFYTSLEGCVMGDACIFSHNVNSNNSSYSIIYGQDTTVFSTDINTQPPDPPNSSEKRGPKRHLKIAEVVDRQHAVYIKNEYSGAGPVALTKRNKRQMLCLSLEVELKDAGFPDSSGSEVDESILGENDQILEKNDENTNNPQILRRPSLVARRRMNTKKEAVPKPLEHGLNDKYEDTQAKKRAIFADFAGVGDHGLQKMEIDEHDELILVDKDEPLEKSEENELPLSVQLLSFLHRKMVLDELNSTPFLSPGAAPDAKNTEEKPIAKSASVLIEELLGGGEEVNKEKSTEASTSSIFIGDALIPKKTIGIEGIFAPVRGEVSAEENLENNEGFNNTNSAQILINSSGGEHVLQMNKENEPKPLNEAFSSSNFNAEAPEFVPTTTDVGAFAFILRQFISHGISRNNDGHALENDEEDSDNSSTDNLEESTEDDEDDSEEDNDQDDSDDEDSDEEECPTPGDDAFWLADGHFCERFLRALASGYDLTNGVSLDFVAAKLMEIMKQETENAESKQDGSDEKGEDEAEVNAESSKLKSIFNARAAEFIPWRKQYNLDIKYSTPYGPMPVETVPQRFIPLCPCFERNGECFDANCSFRHGFVCVICNEACLDLFDQQQWQEHVVECAQKRMEIATKAFVERKNRGKTCGICMENIAEKNHRFGLLSGCSHPFCLQCIRTWRQNIDDHLETETVRRCPTCRVHSDFVIPSYVWPENDAEKRALIQYFKRNAADKMCKYYWGPGDNRCPFYDSCFYRHELPYEERANYRDHTEHHWYTFDELDAFDADAFFDDNRRNFEFLHL